MLNYQIWQSNRSSLKMLLCHCGFVITWQNRERQIFQRFAHLDVSEAGVVSLSRHCSECRVDWPDLGCFDLLSIPKIDEHYTVSRADWV